MGYFLAQTQSWCKSPLKLVFYLIFLALLSLLN